MSQSSFIKARAFRHARSRSETRTMAAVNYPLKIKEITAFAISFPVPWADQFTLGVGRPIKRDAVGARVRTECGLKGFCESHHGRTHTTIAHFINRALHPIVSGRYARDVIGIWNDIYARLVSSMGLGAACAIAMSGIDMALWDIRAKAVGWSLYRMLGGARRAVLAYGRGVALGTQDPSALADEAMRLREAGYRAMKLRLGDSAERDIAHVTAVRNALGTEAVILADANTAYNLDIARKVIPYWMSLQ